ncbi:Hypothetical protein LOCK900_2736 [Lacticaseibacillus rhamnosus LOCK900]|nr:Hypothetical protein LOCK900_2736 [Lacticaseibacillus rhamnosus LOCK900]
MFLIVSNEMQTRKRYFSRHYQEKFSLTEIFIWRLTQAAGGYKLAVIKKK